MQKRVHFFRNAKEKTAFQKSLQICLKKDKRCTDNQCEVFLFASTICQKPWAKKMANGKKRGLTARGTPPVEGPQSGSVVLTGRW